jgi:hypothetical protein
MKRWRRPALYALLFGVLVATPSVAAAFNYASGNLGAGGHWINPVSTNVFQTYNRMSTKNTYDIVHVRFQTTSGVMADEAWSNQFVQSGSTQGLTTRAWCFNDGSYTESGYCAWYN